MQNPPVQAAAPPGDAPQNAFAQNPLSQNPVLRGPLSQGPMPQVIENKQGRQLVHRVQNSNERVDMVSNSSLILAMDHNIPRLQVDNPDLLTLTPLSANQVQIHAKKNGITNVSLWDEQNRLYTVEVGIRADAKALSELLKEQFPGAAIKLQPTNSGVIIRGFVDRPEDVSKIISIAQDEYPKVVNNMRVGGTPQVILHVKVMEVSRTKLRQLGVDFSTLFNQGNSFFSSTAAGVGKLTGVSQVVAAGQTPITSTVGAGGNAPTVALGIVDQSSGFFLFISALQKNELLKVLAEPTLVTVSGRPAYFLSGGEMPIPIPQSLGTISIQFRKFGTQVDFVPIVLGNGRIRLEVRPKISEIDPTIGTTLNNTTVPGFRTREVDTAVELMAGQTLALAGLIQTEVQTTVQGVPYLMDVPYLGVPFRYTTDTVNEVELLIMVRPELAEPLDCDQVPRIGPGVSTTVPDNCGLYFHGYTEVPFDGDALGPQTPPPGAGNGFGPVETQPGEAIPAGRPVDQNSPQAGRDARAASPYATAGQRQSSQDGYVRGTDLGAPAGNVSVRRTPANPNNRANPQGRQFLPGANSNSEPPAFLGPTGYDVGN